MTDWEWFIHVYTTYETGNDWRMVYGIVLPTLAMDNWIMDNGPFIEELPIKQCCF